MQQFHHFGASRESSIQCFSLPGRAPNPRAMAAAPPIFASAALPALTIYSSVDGSASTTCMPTYELNCVTEPRPAPSSSSSFDRSRSGLALAPQPRGVLVARARVFQCAHSHRAADGTHVPCQIRTKIMPYCARHTRTIMNRRAIFVSLACTSL